MRSLDQATRALPREIQPVHDLWPALERHARTRDRRRAVGRVGGVMAGLLVLAVVPTSLLLRAGMDRGTDLERAQADYHRARGELLRALEAMAHVIDPAALEIVRRDLNVVDQDLAVVLPQDVAGSDQEERAATLQASYERDTRILAQTARLLRVPVVYRDEEP